MHAPGHRWSTLILVVIVAMTIGCRGSRPFNPLVRVSQEPDADLPEIEPPQQRLATAELQPESALTSLGTRRSDGSPHVTNAAQENSSLAGKTEKNSALGKTEFSLGDRSLQRTAAKSPEPQTAAKTSATDLSVLDDGDLDSVELMDAFRDYPPEVQREALRRLVATASHKTGKTLQPKSLDSELAKNVLHQHELPDAKITDSDVPPKRIAADPQSEPSTAAAATDVQQPTTADDENETQGRVTDPPTTESASTVRTISDSMLNDQSGVKPASASQSPGDRSNVAHVSIELSMPEKPPVEKDSIKAQIEAEVEAETKQLSDRTLYAAMLKRLSTPVPGESEADRSGRLIKLRHLMVLSGDPDAAVEQIEGLKESEQEYLRHQLLGLWMMIDPQGHPVQSRRFNTALPQIREAAKYAAAATDSLDIRSLSFCTEIESYGQIKTFPGNRFDAGQQVIMYCEIENFTVKRTGEGFETHLQGSYDIYNSENEKVLSQELPADNQVSANYLRDYFIAYQMHLPKQLNAGTYRLQLTMEDVGGKKFGQASIPFEIVR